MGDIVYSKSVVKYIARELWHDGNRIDLVFGISRKNFDFYGERILRVYVNPTNASEKRMDLILDSLEWKQFESRALPINLRSKLYRRV